MADTFETILSEIAQHDYTHKDAAYAIIGHRVMDKQLIEEKEA
ncbi:hypothetical protein LAV_00156 [Sphingobium phage Lacusarx]|uniref:Uncharacterized protein n=1 Tax=Sphingobium phage Lacusarx TaxID=1980139 RepID=A0A1W6DXA9_9CAUD|nr:hypothetical protein FDH44_gp147 [Sphingobium phage Lacusarx]ARK07531.1 hypothetical protein LAV_00156 [Sphingobium phage Lacusarx]